MKCTMRGVSNGMTASSMTARWLDAMMAGPCAGTFSTPITSGVNHLAANGPSVRT